jgi:hypothetical protein
MDADSDPVMIKPLGAPAVPSPGMIHTSPIGVSPRPADAAEWRPHWTWLSPSPPACAPTATPLVKMAPTTATVPAAMATDAAMRFRVVSGHRHRERLTVGVGSVVACKFG